MSIANGWRSLDILEGCLFEYNKSTAPTTPPTWYFCTPQCISQCFSWDASSFVWRSFFGEFRKTPCCPPPLQRLSHRIHIGKFQRNYLNLQQFRQVSTALAARLTDRSEDGDMSTFFVASLCTGRVFKMERCPVKGPNRRSIFQN